MPWFLPEKALDPGYSQRAMPGGASKECNSRESSIGDAPLSERWIMIFKTYLFNVSSPIILDNDEHVEARCCEAECIRVCKVQFM